MKVDYEPVAEVYDSLHQRPVDLAENRVIFDAVWFQLPAEARVLDVGCGTGLLLKYLPISPGRYTGLDNSPTMLNHARMRQPAHQWDEGDACDLPYDDQTFDYVTCLFGSFCHFPRPKLAAEEMHRVLRPGGQATVMLYGHMYRHRASATWNRLRIPMQVEYYDASKAVDRFVRAGFSKVNVQGFHWTQDDDPSTKDWSYERWLTTLTKEPRAKWDIDLAYFLLVHVWK